MAAFLNALREEGTKADCILMLEKMWTDEIALRAELSAMTARAEAAERERDKLRKILDAYMAAGTRIENLDGDLPQVDFDAFLAARGKP